MYIFVSTELELCGARDMPGGEEHELEQWHENLDERAVHQRGERARQEQLARLALHAQHVTSRLPTRLAPLVQACACTEEAELRGLFLIIHLSGTLMKKNLRDT